MTFSDKRTTMNSCFSRRQSRSSPTDTVLHAKWVALAILSAVFGLGGCTHTLYVEGEFPSPLVGKLPTAVGVYYGDEFKNYVYEESSKDRKNWVIDMGDAQVDLFNAVLPNMFNSVVEVDSLPLVNQATGLRLVISPLVEDFQYTLPAETKVKIYEIWLKYNIQVYEPDGTIVADWILTAYGKTPTGFMQSDEAALNQAIVVALRDAGANLSLNFAKVPEIRAWLEQH